VLVDDVLGNKLNPRFVHTFADEDSMMQLKKWSKKSDGRHREDVISRLFRMRLKTLKWKLPNLKNKANKGVLKKRCAHFK